MQNNDVIFGAPGRGDYSQGDPISFREEGTVFSGTVIHCTAPGTLPSGRHRGLTYEVDCHDGFPHMVSSSQVIQLP